MSNPAPETTPPAAADNAKKLIRSKYKDIMVKAGDDIYYLDRLELALNSGYFEKLLLSPDWNEENSEPITVPFDSDTFCAVVKVIYNYSWSAVLTMNNYVSVMKAKDFFEIKIGHFDFSNFISYYLEETSKSDMKVFELIKFIVENGSLEKENSLNEIYEYLAKNLEHFQDNEEFLSLPIDHFVKVIAFNKPLNGKCEEYVRRPYHQDRRLVVEVCCKWICHDIQNRLPLIVDVSNSALEGLIYMRKGNNPCIKVNLSGIDEQSKFEVVMRYFKRLMDYGTVLDPGVAERPGDFNRRIEKDYEYYEHFDEERKSKMEKFKEYVKNGDLYDITVQVQGKSYKLHRSILKSKSGYFKELFSTEYAEATAKCDGLPSLPDKNKEYVIEGIDEPTFDFLVNYFYSEGRPSDDEYIRVFKAAHILKINELLRKCESHLGYHINEINSKGNITDILDFTEEKDEYENLYLNYLKKYIRMWPHDGYKEAFYSFPWSQLENWLLSPDFYFDDAENLLNLCSAWIMHDVKNRYHLIPRIALAIKNYGLPDFEDYNTETPTDLSNVSEKQIRDKLWNILSSLSLIPTSTGTDSSSPRKFDDWPAFVTSTSGGIFDIHNINFDRIATLSFRKSYREFFGDGRRYPMSAAIIKDNLFIMCKIGGYGFVLAYHIPTNNFIELNTDFRIKSDDNFLNCGNELFCGGSEDGSLLKYSFELNRWSRVSKPESDKSKVRFTSDGDKIYRLFQVPGSETEPTPGYNVEWFDFQQNQWVFLSSLPSPLPSGRSDEDKSDEIIDFTIINDHANPTILLKKVILWYDQNSLKWHHLRLPEGQYWSRIGHNHAVIIQAGNGIVQVFNNKLYHYSDSKKIWELRTEMDIPNKFTYGEAPYYNIVAVNRPIALVLNS